MSFPVVVGGDVGPAGQSVIDGIVQEVNIKTGKVLFQWDSASHVPYRDSYQPLPATASTPWDWFHVNAVHLARDGSLLIGARPASELRRSTSEREPI